MTLSNHRKLELMSAARAEPENIVVYNAAIHFRLAGIQVGVRLHSYTVYIPYDQESAELLQECGVGEVARRIFAERRGTWVNNNRGITEWFDAADAALRERIMGPLRREILKSGEIPDDMLSGLDRAVQDYS